MDADFYEQYKLAHKERRQREDCEKYNLSLAAEKEYNMFSFWARINNADLTEKSFKKYLKDTKRKILGAIKVVIAEKYFGYSKKYDNKNNKYIYYKNI